MSKVSVIIPAYNCGQYIAQTIQSILAQKEASDLEIIVVNDGSSDGTSDIAKAFGDPVAVIDQDNAGVCSARNRGLREASGEFVAFLDHDDYWLPNKLTSQLVAFNENPDIDVVFTGFVLWHSEQNGQFSPPSNYDSRSSPQEIDKELSGWIYHQMLLDSWVLTSTALVRKAVALNAGGFDESLPFSEDWDFWLRVSRTSQFIKLREKSTLYRQHPTQGSRKLREIDYRTDLLEQAARKWGMSSNDGRRISNSRFRRQLAKYSTAFGLDHLKAVEGANRSIAARSFLRALSFDWCYWPSLAYLVAMGAGWRRE